MRLENFDYILPEELIAQHPAVTRDASRLMRLDRQTGKISSGQFPEIVDSFVAGDVLVLNDTRVRPARILGTKESGGRRAVGATPGSIIGMIIQESVALTSIAGYAGLVAGVVTLEVVSTGIGEGFRENVSFASELQAHGAVTSPCRMDIWLVVVHRACGLWTDSSLP